MRPFAAGTVHYRRSNTSLTRVHELGQECEFWGLDTTLPGVDHLVYETGFSLFARTKEFK
jgi:hypothetical protein